VPGAPGLTVHPFGSVAGGTWGKGGGGPADPQDLNRYSYGLNNPVRNTDPSGHCSAERTVYNPKCTGQTYFRTYEPIEPPDPPLPPNRDGGNPPKIGAVGPNAAAMAAKEGATRTYQTYTKTNPETGTVYSGRTSGVGSPLDNVARRDQNHHMNEQGYGPAVLDQSTNNLAAARGREQQLIDLHGGAQRTGGTSGNQINGIRQNSPRRQYYLDEADRIFGPR
jgi:hypothetical protein